MCVTAHSIRSRVRSRRPAFRGSALPIMHGIGSPTFGRGNRTNAQKNIARSGVVCSEAWSWASSAWNRASMVTRAEQTTDASVCQIVEPFRSRLRLPANCSRQTLERKNALNGSELLTVPHCPEAMTATNFFFAQSTRNKRACASNSL